MEPQMSLLSIVMWIIVLYLLAALGERFNAFLLRNVLMPHTEALPQSLPLQPISPHQSQNEVTPTLTRTVPRVGVLRQKEGDLWKQLDNLQNNKMWHELTLKLLETVQSSEFHGQDNAKKLYLKYVKDSQTKMNPMLVAEVVTHLAAKYEHPTEAAKLLQDAEEAIKDNEGAVALCKTARADTLFNRMGDVKGAKTLLDEAENSLGGTPVTANTHGRFYLLLSRWHESQGHHVEVYYNVLRYLGCVDISSLSENECVRLAKVLSVSLIVGEGLYDFGQVLCHPITGFLLKSSEHAWLLQLLLKMNDGRMDEVLEMKKTCAIEPDLEENWERIHEKAQLLCVMEIFFSQPPNKREATFLEIEEKTRASSNDVEELLMRAMARGLIRGSINQVEGSVNVTWVRPRMLNTEQLNSLVERLDDWCSEVKSFESWIAEKVEELESIS